LLFISYGGGKDEKEEIASLGVAFGRLSLRRMRNDSRDGGRYTEHRESREKDSLGRIGRNLNAGVDPLSFLKLSVKSRLKMTVGQETPAIDARLIKAEAYQSCGLRMPEKTLQDYFTSKTFRPIGPHPDVALRVCTKLSRRSTARRCACCDYWKSAEPTPEGWWGMQDSQPLTVSFQARIIGSDAAGKYSRLA